MSRSPYTLKTLLQSQPINYSIFMNTGNAFICEIFASAGMDIIAVDCQHGLYTEDTARQAFQAISAHNAIPIARSRWNDPAHIMRLLDFGAMGIICPMVNTPEDAQHFVNACRYSPQGKRSFGPIRASVIHGAEYHQHANDSILTIAMIETKQGLDNLDAILDIDTLDGIFVGPNDLSIDLGHPPLLDNDHQEFDAIMCHIASKANAKEKIIAVFTSGGAKKRIAQGYNMLIMANETMILKQHATQMLKDIKNL